MKKTALQTEYRDFTLFYLKRDRAIGGLISRSGKYEPFEIETILALLKPGAVAVDVGANIGTYTLPLARAVGGRGRIYAFEPEEDNRNLLIQNLVANHIDNVLVSPIALGQKQQVMKLHLSRTNFGDHRLFSEDDKTRRSKDVQLDTLDHQLMGVLGVKHRVNLIKSDTQGFEPFVVAGSKTIIETYRPALFLEYWPWGFSRSGADKDGMIAFLRSLYPQMYLVDEKNHRLLTVDQPFIDEYCQAHQGYMHCNLAFLP